MFSLTRCRVSIAICSIALASAMSGLAQTLEHRPSSPTQSAAPAKSVPAEPVLPEGTSLQVEITRHYPMRESEVIEGRLLHPLYIEGKLAVPQNTLVYGKVLELDPDMKSRWHGRLRGDFTPFHIARVEFGQLVLPGGPLPIATTTAANGAPVLHLVAPGVSPKRSFISRRWMQFEGVLQDRAAWFTAPGIGDRALQMFYHQLPYHPERIEAHTAWTFELTAPLTLPDRPFGAIDPSVNSAETVQTSGQQEIWAVHALLTQDLTSARAKAGDPVAALVVEPVYDKQNQLVVPQGSTLFGKVTAASAARSFGRNGKLRFNFQQVRFPEGPEKPVEGSLSGALTQKTQNLQLDAEGTITPRNQSSAIGPLLLTMLAARALDDDGNLGADTAVASNGFGLVGRIVGIAAGNRNLAAGFGYYAAALSFYENFLQSGRDVVFPKDTRIEIETRPLRAPTLKPDSQ